MKKVFLLFAFLIITSSFLFAQAPTLGTYPATTIATASGNSTVTPTASPTNAVSITASTSTNFKGLIHVNPATGIVTVTNAQPAGTYIVNITAFNGSSVVTTTFQLTVNNSLCSQGQFSSIVSTSVGTGPNAVAIGDFNNDGNQDFASANRNANSVTICLGSGSGIFSITANVIIGIQPLAIALNDFNGDGNLDFAVANNGSNTISIRLGNGAGGFSGTTEIATGSNVQSVTTCDFNQDAKPDLAIVSANTNNTVSIRLGNGIGGFTGNVEVGVGSYPYAIAIGDFNNDGKTDFASANTGSASISVRLGDGTGNFSGTTTIAVGNNPQTISAGDFNNDGKIDLATANNATANVSILLGNGAGGFAPSVNYTVGTTPRSIIFGDFNGDGKSDFIAANQNSNNISVRFGDGSGGFYGTTNMAVGFSPYMVANGDFNSDGRQDILLTNPSGNSVAVFNGIDKEINVQGNNVNIVDGATLPALANHTEFGNIDDTLSRTYTIQSTGTGSITLNSIEIGGTDSASFAVSDIALPATLAAGSSVNFKVYFTPTSAGLKTAVIKINNNDCDESVYDFIVQGTGIAVPVVLGNYPDTITVLTASKNLIITSSASPSNALDFTATISTGFKGTIHANPTTGVITIANAHPAGTYLVKLKAYHGFSYDVSSFLLIVNNTACSQGQFTTGANVSSNGNPYAIAISDFNNDGNQDLVIANQVVNTVSLRQGNGNGGFTGNVQILVSTKPSAIAVADFNGDGNQDFLSAGYTDSIVSVRLGNGIGNFTNASNVSVGSAPVAMVVADFNGDGKPDFITANENSNTFSIRLGNGKGNFNSTINQTTGFRPKYLAVGDFNNDGNQDVAITCSFYISINLGNGAGVFSEVAQLTLGYTPNSIMVADLNKDGNQDLVITDIYSSVYIRLGNGTGSFSGTGVFTVGSAPSAINAGDFNGDGNQDIALLGGHYPSGGDVTILLGNGAGSFNATTGITGLSAPQAIAIGDFNSDDNQDIVIADASSGISIRLNTLTDINLLGNNITIPDGDSIPTISDFTDFGSTSQSIIRTYTIKNTSTVKLMVNNIYVSGSDSSMFILGGISLPATIAAGASTTFRLNFVPKSGGIKKAMVNIINDDCDESVYSFAIQATGIVSTILGNYPATTIKAGSNTTVTPSATPTIAAPVTASASGNFKGLLQVNATTGVVSIINAYPVGTYIITVGNPSAPKQFTLTVSNSDCSQSRLNDSSKITFHSNPAAVAVGDFNNDGKQDLVVSQLLPSDSVNILLNSGSGSFYPASATKVGGYIYCMVVSDFNGDGNLDYAADSENGIFICLCNGSGGVLSKTVYGVGSMGALIRNMAVGDFNGDGWPDIATANFGSNKLYIKINDGTGAFIAAPDVVIARNLTNVDNLMGSVAIADFDNDGKQDIAVLSLTSNSIFILKGDGTGGFATKQSYVINSKPVAIAIGDLNSDNKPDIAVTVSQAAMAAVFLNNGTGGFTYQQGVLVQNNPQGLVINDMNGDGYQDIITANTASNTVSVRFGNGAGVFSGNVNIPVASGPYDLALGDFNADGKLDLAVPGANSKNLSIRISTNNEINVQGNNNTISAGSNSTDTTNFTDFGVVSTGGSLTRTFTIQNTGVDTLHINNIIITGNDSLLFTQSGITLPTTILAGTSKTFTLTFSAVGNGLKTARVNIINDDCDESVFDFAVRGNASCGTLGPDNIWIGTSANWNTANNWSLGFVPLACTRVIINSGVPFMPQISTAASCYSLILNNGAVVNVIGTGHLIITGP